MSWFRLRYSFTISSEIPIPSVPDHLLLRNPAHSRSARLFSPPVLEYSTFLIGIRPWIRDVSEQTHFPACEPSSRSAQYSLRTRKITETRRLLHHHGKQVGSTT
ncbi:uncharacterized protein ARMOST_18168 [Armillaria ostoyae]|uniref:Uncharacterized protein n=1 Tax=Armillaria ostoyae TaxID=47428 RepID=A0A284S108_ARMOS|nr:uncharacterized protein ARMOST_18168 [Armillaria ostoyae]